LGHGGASRTHSVRLGHRTLTRQSVLRVLRSQFLSQGQLGMFGM